MLRPGDSPYPMRKPCGRATLDRRTTTLLPTSGSTAPYKMVVAGLEGALTARSANLGPQEASYLNSRTHALLTLTSQA